MPCTGCRCSKGPEIPKSVSCHRLVYFMEQCLRVDAEQRPSAAMLKEQALLLTEGDACFHTSAPISLSLGL